MGDMLPGTSAFNQIEILQPFHAQNAAAHSTIEFAISGGLKRAASEAQAITLRAFSPPSLRTTYRNLDKVPDELPDKGQQRWVLN
jgi:hypothetical protein